MTDAKHEAPAEGAGEMFGDETAEQIVRRWADWINDVSDDMEQPDWGGKTLNDVLNERDFLIRHLLRARSSAPEAREGEATARQWRAVDEQGPRTSWRELDWRSEAEVRDWEASHTVEYRDLYTHPAAPSADKLRIAVEALEEITDTDPDEGTSWFHERADQALAAMIDAILADGEGR